VLLPKTGTISGDGRGLPPFDNLLVLLEAETFDAIEIAGWMP
jgi:hypothetical protein